MNAERRSLHRVAVLVSGLLTLVTIAAAPDPRLEGRLEERLRRGTVQSELDYLRAAKLPISIELSEVTARQAYDGIAKKAELSISFDGTLNGDSKHSLSFKDRPLKEVLAKLGEMFELSYRVDNPDKLTVIGAKSKSGGRS